jgi:hypothetical protein
MIRDSDGVPANSDRLPGKPCGSRESAGKSCDVSFADVTEALVSSALFGEFPDELAEVVSDSDRLRDLSLGSDILNSQLVVSSEFCHDTWQTHHV